MQNIANKVVIITGASSGIGEATAFTLAAEGAKLVLGARREDKLKAIAARVAEVVAFALAQPDDTNISEFTIGPTTQPW